MASRRQVVVPPFGGGDAVGGIGVGRGIHTDESDYSHTVHFDKENSEPM